MRTLLWSVLFSVFVVAGTTVPAAGAYGAAAKDAGAIAVFPLAVDPLTWVEQKLVATGGAAGDGFGYAISISGTTAVIGAPFATVEGNFKQGTAYVFTESDGTWTLAQTLTAPDGAANDEFGTSVALSGDALVVGADEAAVDGHEDQGAVYVFSRTGGAWSEVQKLTASDGAGDGHFGFSVALGDDGALVGAPFATVDGNDVEGATYVFTQSGRDWTELQKLTASDGDASFQFGTAMAISGTTALISAIGSGSFAQGSAYIFTESDGSWIQSQKLTASDAGFLDSFGVSVALDDTTAVIGAPLKTVNGVTNQGAAYVFSSSGGTWTQAEELTAPDGAAKDYFGTSAAVDGATALIGAYGATVDGNDDQGKVYVYGETNGGWQLRQELTASDGGAEEAFGFAAQLSGTTALVGAHSLNGSQGAAYFEGASDLDLMISVPQSVAQDEQYVSQTIATNNASSASPAVAVTVGVPAAASFVSATASQGSCSEASGVVTCDFDQIPGNAGTATANVTLKATGSSGTTIENTASVVKATPALTASAATEITNPASCPAGYSKFSGHLDADGTFTSSPIEVTEAGEKYVDLTAPASFAFFAITNTRYGQHTYVYPHAKHGHRWGAAGSYQVGVQAGPDAGGDYTLCVNLNPAQ